MDPFRGHFRFSLVNRQVQRSSKKTSRDSWSRIHMDLIT